MFSFSDWFKVVKEDFNDLSKSQIDVAVEAFKAGFKTALKNHHDDMIVTKPFDEQLLCNIHKIIIEYFFTQPLTKQLVQRIADFLESVFLQIVVLANTEDYSLEIINIETRERAIIKLKKE